MTPIDLRRRHLLAAMALLPAAASARPAPSAAAVLLAQDAPPDIDPAGYLVSEKFDGVRAVWDGRQLRYRSGLPIAAPAWFLARLPTTPLDGELWLGRGRFEALSGVVRRTEPRDDEWQALRYLVFEQPGGAGTFAARAAALRGIASQANWPLLVAVDQTVVSHRAGLQERLDQVVRGGGEGLMLHRADSPYVTGRSSVLLKLKPLLDAEAVVIGHVAGRGRLQGRLGALTVRTPQGDEFQIGSGFSDAQRDDPPPIGSVVTYQFRGTTARGLPRFASYLRVRSLP